MWKSLYSTGVQEFDTAHEQIDALLGEVATADTPEEEQRYLMQLYCAIIDHIRFKTEFLGPRLSLEEKEHDAQFLREVRDKIRQRGRGRITAKELIADLRTALIDHAAHHQHHPGPSAS